MKDQYFGDINDYRKYGLLRILTGHGAHRLAVCWMLTPPDGRGDGRFTEYLRAPAAWRPFDPELFDALHGCVLKRGSREVRHAAGVLPGARFDAAIVPDCHAARAECFERTLTRARGCELLFFDPDNGLEVRSTPRGRAGSSKYLYWTELEQAYRRGHSVLVYQHFPRVRRDPFVERLAGELLGRTAAPEVVAFSTARVLFLLVPQRAHRRRLLARTRVVERQWREQFRITRHPACSSADARATLK
jgi:hypothetical protein